MRKLLLVVMLFLFVNPSNALALSCAKSLEIDEAYEKYDGIIIGQVEDVIRKKANNQIKLKVIKSFKGIEEASVLAKENMTWGSLDGPSEIGVEYLFFLREKEGAWENPLCSPTLKAAEATDQLAYLHNKEILLKSTPSPALSPSPTAPPSSNITKAEAPSEVKIGKSSYPINWIVILIFGCLLGVIGYRVIRYSKRRK